MQIKDLKKDQIFWDSSPRGNFKLIALEDARFIDEPGKKGWYCLAKGSNGKEIGLFVDHEIDHYGPRLYPCPMYSFPQGSDPGDENT